MMIQQKLVRPFKITMKFNLGESLLTKLEKKYQLCFLSGFEIKFEQTLKFCLKNNQVWYHDHDEFELNNKFLYVFIYE